MEQEISLIVNGQAHSIVVEPDTPLLYVLRNDLGLTAAKFACGQEQCGACKVIVDGYAVPSCRTPVRYVQRRKITTLEGVWQDGTLHRLQQAFIEEQALQCGFCTPGMIMAGIALLERKPQASDDEIRSELRQNLCRCGIYDRVLRAIRRAAGRPTAAPSYHLEAATAVPQPPSAALPRSLLTNPDLDAWIRIDEEETVTVFTGKVEIGQGILTSVAQIAAEELDVSMNRIRVVSADTDRSPDEGITAGSMSMESTGQAMRYAAAQARFAMLSIAYEELEAPIERLVVEDGIITDPVSRRKTSYWRLMGGKKFGRIVSGSVEPKSPDTYRIVGKTVNRLDLVDKVTGKCRFVHDLSFPGMVHGRVVRPPHFRARLKDLDDTAARRMSGVLEIVRDGSFLGVIAEREEQAVKAAEALSAGAVWEGDSGLGSCQSLEEHLRHYPDEPLLIVEGTAVEYPPPPVAVPAEAVKTVKATFFRPYQMHASIGPSAAVALWNDDELTLWAHTQGVFPVRAAVSSVLGLDPGKVRVIHVEGPGCYGHNGADDAALDAALLARVVPGRPISLKWSRADENGWEPYGPAAVIDMQASLDGDGRLLDWNHDVWCYPHFGRPRADAETSGHIAAGHLSTPWPRPVRQAARGYHSAGHRNADPLYKFPRRRIVKHFVSESPLPTSSQRGLGAYTNVLAIESFMDELAFEAGEDPLSFRLRHLSDERARAVLNAAAEKAGWDYSRTWPAKTGRGRGLAFAQYKNRQCYVAIIVDVSVDVSSGEIRLESSFIAAEAGQVVNPDGLSNQLEGGFIQAASWTLKEEVMFDAHGVISLDWLSYPILAFPETPAVEIVILNRPGFPFVGVGEAAVGPAGAAIANAIFDSAGVRLRRVPFTPERVKEALSSQSVQANQP